MSHLKERKENNCLNCNAVVTGKFCSICGQENIEPAESAWHLVTHFFNDITHFDGKFFSSLKFLIFKPGFLSSEYKMGRRASYLNPIRMYVFTSAIFFLVFFSAYHFDDLVNDTPRFNGETLSAIDKMDSTDFSNFTKKIKGGKPLTRNEFKNYIDTVQRAGFLEFPKEYKSRSQYDSLLKKGVLHESWLKRHFVYKQLEINEKYKNDSKKIINVLMGIFIHNIPQMLFVSLPLFALFLKLIYIRRKDFYYASHAIFSIHFYIFVFIVGLLLIGCSKLSDYAHWHWVLYPSIFLYFYIFYYQYKAMRYFYGQRRAKTILKFILLNGYFFVIMILLFIVFLFLSFLKV